MTSVDVNAVVALHRERKAKATIVLTPVDNPSAYGLVETEADGRVRRFLEKPNPDEITCDTINAGIYVLEPETFDRIPKDVSYSIERAYFPSLIERKETFVAYVDRGYWIDIGTPEKYVQVHHDMFDGKFAGGLFATRRSHASRSCRPRRASKTARRSAGPASSTPARTSRPAPRSAATRCSAAAWSSRKSADLQDTIVWPNTRIGQNAVVHGPIIGRNCHIGRDAVAEGTSLLGDKTQLTDFTSIGS